jgi:PPK2 family polyphosphate:nucleotide phosphotransferase
MASSSDDYRVRVGSKVNLSKWHTEDRGGFKDKDEAAPLIEKHLEKLRELQGVMYAEAKHALLVVFQAMDAGGKDGAIQHIFSGVNPQGCQVTSFKVPSDLEKRHDFLWRHHFSCPPRGIIGVHNRSHYEAVLVERVKNIVPKHMWKERYDHINDWEEMLTESGTTIIKFFLHISKDEQKKRLQDRLSDPQKMWKFSSTDVEEREHWDAYQKAYEDLLERCSTSVAPWYIVPSDVKWFRNWVISDALVRTLKGLKMEFPPPEKGIANVKVV